ncbi:MAG: hypothetical protein HWD59_06835 [Coxiellaceae bacterium]|nr:MAG: hypothetical protein HWD59_06835 [Coxiellaceae bacterium]
MTSSKTKHLSKKSKDAPVPEEKEEITKMNVNVPKSFYKQIKQRALDEDTTVTEIVIKALRQYLNKY